MPRNAYRANYAAYIERLHCLTIFRSKKGDCGSAIANDRRFIPSLTLGHAGGREFCINRQNRLEPTDRINEPFRLILLLDMALRVAKTASKAENLNLHSKGIGLVWLV